MGGRRKTTLHRFFEYIFIWLSEFKIFHLTPTCLAAMELGREALVAEAVLVESTCSP